MRASVVASWVIMGAASVGSSGAWAWIYENPSSASQCSASDIDDAGVGAENCLINNVRVAYKMQSTGPVQLSPLSSGAPCSAGAINNASVGKETIIGVCADGNNVSQGVMWARGTTPTQLQPATALLGLIALGVSTTAININDAGVVIGVSTDGNGTDAPVYWSGSGAATLLSSPLLEPLANCRPASINSAKSVVGNCPSGALGGGKNMPVLWSSLWDPYQALPTPSGASYCIALEINANSQILGECSYGTDSKRAVQWGAGGTGPVVMASVNGTAVLHSSAATQNDAGVVAVNYLANGAQNGFAEPAVWNPAGGNTNATSITLPSGAVKGTVGGIGNNGKLVGNFETADGRVNPFHVEPGSTVAAGDGDPAGGANAMATALSKGGEMEAVTAEDTSKHAQAEVGSTP
ncbi:HAF family protein [Burkholderia sp. BCC0322]|uniref:HAF family protein n=1 Tax=unclassified Burkholderia TaxID=2613784 RepID=UPI00158C7DDB|nr:HAF family protein [Burkholderia sp. BCC0322]